MMLLLKFVLFAKLKNLLIIYVTNFLNVNHVIWRNLFNNTIKVKMIYCKNRRDKYAHSKNLDNRVKALEENRNIIWKKAFAYWYCEQYMIKKTLKILLDEICSTWRKQNYITRKNDVFYVDNTWSVDIIDLKDYGPEKNRGYRYVSLVIDNFNKLGWTLPLRNKKPKQWQTLWRKNLKN